MELLVVGAGAMGRWFAAAVDADVTFTDLDAAAAERAAEATDAEATTTPGEDYDVVCIAVPMSAASEAIASHAHRGAALVDVTGEMTDAVAAMADHAPDAERVSLHPLFAPENAPGNVAVVADVPGPLTAEIRADLAARGNDLFETTAAEHDRAMETVQSAAHTAVLAYALAAEDVPDRFHTPVSAGLTDLVDGVTGNTPQVYAEIQAAFEGADAVADAAARLAAADDETFERLYREAGGAGTDDGPGGGA